MRTAIFITGLLIAGKNRSEVGSDNSIVVIALIFFVMDVIELVI